jgi:hypothetical protein
MKIALILAVCIAAVGCTPAFCEKNNVEYEQGKCAQWVQEQQEEAQRAMIFANFANGLSAGLNGSQAAPAPVTYSVPPPRSSPAPVRNTSSCYPRKNLCWNACHPANFGQDVDYSAQSRCVSNCDTEFNNCISR